MEKKIPCGKRARHTAIIGRCPLCHELFPGETAFHGPTCIPPSEVIWGNPSPESPWWDRNKANEPSRDVTEAL